MFRIVVFGVLIATAMSSMAFAEPQIIRIEGNVGTDASVTLFGDSFGTKSPAGPVIWDHLSNQPGYAGLSHGDPIPTQNDDDCDDCPWRWAEYGPHTYFNQNTRVPDVPFYRMDVIGYFAGDDYGTIDPKVLYVNWWFRASKEIHDNSSSSKFIRIWTGSEHAQGASSWTQMHCTRYNDSDHDGVDNADDHVHWGQWGGDSELNRWYHMESYADGRGDYTRGYGKLVHSVDNVTKHDLEYFAPTYPMNRLYKLGIGHSVSTEFANETFDLSEVYVDTTLARVALGDAPNWSDVRHYELQIPTNWSSGEVTFDVNHGDFGPEPDLWLYVFDRNGDTNVDGFPIDGLPIPEGPGRPGQPIKNP